MEKVKVYLESNGRSFTKLAENTLENEKKNQSSNFNEKESSIEVCLPVSNLLKGSNDKVLLNLRSLN